MNTPTTGNTPTASPTPWQQFADQAPDLAERMRARFTAARHHVLATLTRDGSPRVSGTEVEFRGDDLLIGSMWEARKARDLRRDGRFALHAHTGDGSMACGDAKLTGLAVEVIDPTTLRAVADDHHMSGGPSEPFHLFQLLIGTAVLTSVHPDGDRLVIESWRPGEPVRRVERR
ncbi:MAG: pyridoxamine 5'-phosphate oxidase family protein [Actinobacteria bacterium]|nr:pyridoxamine 5'-phosphate oxidase family protein [Actinomycetota bacterium]MBI3687961.1 pyridoxamine 5'-phosphate oxidase family protein [Actinomycetota bacterium]